MLVVHWSPVKNTKQILRNGIRKSRRGICCFPLTGHAIVDRWWAQLFRAQRPRTQYNGFIFRLCEDDLPAKFSDWIVDVIGAAKTIDSLQKLEAEFRKTIVWQIGATHSQNHDEDFEALGDQLIRQDSSRVCNQISIGCDGYSQTIRSFSRIRLTANESSESSRDRNRRGGGEWPNIGSRPTSTVERFV